MSRMYITTILLALVLIVLTGTVIAQSEPDTTDTEAPSVPTGLTTKSKTAYSAEIIWNASTDTGGSGVAGYDIYKGSTLIGSVSATTFKESGLGQDTTYSYQIAAYDNDDNTSARSNTYNVVTNVLGDLNGDKKINAVDLSLVLSKYGKSDDTAPAGDANGNGAVNAVDLSIVLSKYGYSS